MIQRSWSYAAHVLLLWAVSVTFASAQQETTPQNRDVASQNTAVMPIDLASKLDAQLRGKIVTLREPSSNKTLKFAADGSPMGKQESGAWSLFSKIQVEQVEGTSDAVVMTGKRAFVRFDDAENPQLFKSDEKVRIELAVPRSTSMPRVAGALHKIFLAPNEPLANFPAYWQFFFDQNKAKASGQATTPSPPPSGTWMANSRALKVGGRIVPPHATFTPDPSYDHTSRSYGVEGRTILWCIVNEQGAAEDIKIVKPLGMGLDERAVEAVSKWRFRPAMKDGKAVPVQIDVEVKFRLK